MLDTDLYLHLFLLPSYYSAFKNSSLTFLTFDSSLYSLIVFIFGSLCVLNLMLEEKENIMVKCKGRVFVCVVSRFMHRVSCFMPMC